MTAFSPVTSPYHLQKHRAGFSDSWKMMYVLKAEKSQRGQEGGCFSDILGFLAHLSQGGLPSHLCKQELSPHSSPADLIVPLKDLIWQFPAWCFTGWEAWQCSQLRIMTTTQSGQVKMEVEGGKTSQKPKAKHSVRPHGNASATIELCLSGEEAVGGQ